VASAATSQQLRPEQAVAKQQLALLAIGAPD
jgi:hypothetical protein